MSLPSIPFIDLREQSLAELATLRRQEAIDLLIASRYSWGMASHLACSVALPISDRLSRRWLERTENPYREEVARYATLLGVSGVSALNICYEWGCTSGAFRQGNSMGLARVLDWPFPRLGEYVVVAHLKGKAGEFYGVTWPATSGLFQGMAPRRFSAAINQAPMRRYGKPFAIDWLRNRITLGKKTGITPAHLLRQVFEAAASYDEAKTILANTPLCIPAIFTLSGVKPGEGCVIERLEDSAAIRELEDAPAVCAANHFESPLQHASHGWHARGDSSKQRLGDACANFGNDNEGKFSWFKAPIANSFSRVVMVANAADHTLSVMGTNGATPVTQVFTLP